MKKLMRNENPTHFETSHNLCWFVQDGEVLRAFELLEEALCFFLVR